MSNITFRVNVLAGHLLAAQRSEMQVASVSGSGALGWDTQLGSQECAATAALLFARPAAPATHFARPISEEPSIVQLEALGAATLSCHLPSSAFQPPPAGLNAAVSTPQSASHELPRYARPVSAQQNEHAQCEAPVQIPEDKSSLATVSSAATSSGDWAPQTLVQESEFGYLLQALLPGVKARDVRAELVPGSRLVISGTRRGRMGGPFPELFAALPEVFGLAKGPGTQGMASGSFEIVWRLPGDANLDSLRAEVKDGCLLVKVSKRSVLTLL